MPALGAFINVHVSAFHQRHSTYVVLFAGFFQIVHLGAYVGGFCAALFALGGVFPQDGDVVTIVTEPGGNAMSPPKLPGYTPAS